MVFVSSKSKAGKRLIRVGKDVNPVPADVKAWNERVEREKRAKKFSKDAKTFDGDYNEVKK